MEWSGAGGHEEAEEQWARAFRRTSNDLGGQAVTAEHRAQGPQHVRPRSADAALPPSQTQHRFPSRTRLKSSPKSDFGSRVLSLESIELRIAGSAGVERAIDPTPESHNVRETPPALGALTDASLAGREKREER